MLTHFYNFVILPWSASQHNLILLFLVYFTCVKYLSCLLFFTSKYGYISFQIYISLITHQNTRELFLALGSPEASLGKSVVISCLQSSVYPLLKALCYCTRSVFLHTTSLPQSCKYLILHRITNFYCYLYKKLCKTQDKVGGISSNTVFLRYRATIAKL